LKTYSKKEIPDDAIRTGLSNVRELSGLSGRLTVISEQPLIVVDVAHNADAVSNLIVSLKRLRIKRPVVVFGVLKDKDYASMVRDLASVASEAVAVAPRTPRSRPASDVVAAFERVGCKCYAALSVKEGMKLAGHLAGTDGLILVTGSHFVVGEAMMASGLKRA
jgi:dihydrofolate synthase/folylpolyglutamate synthase